MGVTCHFVDVMATLTSRPVEAMKAWEFAETVEGMLLEVINHWMVLVW